MGSSSEVGRQQASRVPRAQFVKFLIVGGINTLFGYGVFALFISLGVHYAVASLLGTVLGILFNFKTTGTIVFRNRDNGLLLRFVGVYTVIFFINVACLKVLDLFRVNMYLAGAVLVLPAAFISFLLQKRFVFTRGMK